MRILVSFVTFILTLQVLCAQSSTPQISVSTEKIRENGVVKYVHHVKKGETIYALSKAYGLTTEEILKSNPNLKSGLRSGMIVFIPSVPTQATANTKVEPEQAVAKAPNNKKFRKHTAKWYETIEDIATSYRVSVEDLMTLNNLKDKTLSRRQVLLIPDTQTTLSASKPSTTEPSVPIILETTIAIADSTSQIGILNESPIERPVKRLSNYGTAKISVILPLNGSDSTALNYNFMDFYAGALLAANKLKEEGVDLEINLFDQNTSSVKNIITMGRLNSSQLIIGPVRGYDVKEILEYAQNNSIPIISPMDQQVEQYLTGNPYLLQVPSLSQVQTKNLLKQLHQDYNNSQRGANVLLCYEREGADTTAIRITKAYLNEHQIPYSTISYGILDGRGMLHQIKSAIDYTHSNLVIVPSNSEAFVNDLVRNLNLCLTQDKERNTLGYIAPKHLINLYGLSKWKNFETIEPEYFHKMNLCLSLPYHIDYNNEEVKEFLLKFRALYKAEPSPYAFQGYDIIKYFTPQVRNYGKEFVNVLQLENGKMLQSDYNFSRDNSANGFGNQATRTIKYNPDFSITTLHPVQYY